MLVDTYHKIKITKCAFILFISRQTHFTPWQAGGNNRPLSSGVFAVTSNGKYIDSRWFIDPGDNRDCLLDSLCQTNKAASCKMK